MTYLLENIEIWIYNNKNFPSLIEEKSIKKFIGKRYGVREFNLLEKNIERLLNKKYNVIEFMNPLYPNWKVTTISVDVYEKKGKIIKKKESNNNYLDKKTETAYKTMVSLLKDRQKKIKKVFSTGKGSLKLINENGMFFSDDKKISRLEKSIGAIFKKNLEGFFLNLEKGNNDLLLEAMQWVTRDPNVMKMIFYKLREGNFKEKNIVLKQLIPLVNNISKEQKKYLMKFFQDRLFVCPTSSIRNKGLSIMSDMTNIEFNFSDEFKKFLERISQTTQYNCSYPAREIRKSLSLDQ